LTTVIERDHGKSAGTSPKLYGKSPRQVCCGQLLSGMQHDEDLQKQSDKSMKDDFVG